MRNIFFDSLGKQLLPARGLEPRDADRCPSLRFRRAETFQKKWEDIDNYKERFYFCLKHLHELSDLPDGFAEGIWAKLARQSEFAEMPVNVKKEYIRKMTTVSLPLNSKVLLPVDTIDANCYCDCYVLTDLKNEIEILYNKWNECFHIK